MNLELNGTETLTHTPFTELKKKIITPEQRKKISEALKARYASGLPTGTRGRKRSARPRVTFDSNAITGEKFEYNDYNFVRPAPGVRVRIPGTDGPVTLAKTETGDEYWYSAGRLFSIEKFPKWRLDTQLSPLPKKITFPALDSPADTLGRKSKWKAYLLSISIGQVKYFQHDNKKRRTSCLNSIRTNASSLSRDAENGNPRFDLSRTQTGMRITRLS